MSFGCQLVLSNNFCHSAKIQLVDVTDKSLIKGNNNISSEAALKLLKAAEEKSRDLGVKMNIAVVDSGANLVGFLRSVYQ